MRVEELLEVIVLVRQDETHHIPVMAKLVGDILVELSIDLTADA